MIDKQNENLSKAHNYFDRSEIKIRINNEVDKIKSLPGIGIFVENFIKHNFVSENGEKIYPKIFLVGGAVRDCILQKPCKDYDFVVQGLSKKQLSSYLDNIPGRSNDVESRNFGVFKFKPKGSKTEIDIALPRLDVYEEYGKGHNDVEIITNENLTIKDDLSRRDFTINAMAIDINSCELIDYFNGLQDLEHGLIKSVGDPHDRMVAEDPTRMLRAIRFASNLNFIIEENTLNTINNHHQEITKTFQQVISRNGRQITREVARVSAESLASELIKSFYANPVKTIILLDELGIYKTILSSELIRIWEGLKTTSQPLNYHAEGSVWNHTLIVLGNLYKLKYQPLGLSGDVDINLVLAAFLHDFGKVDTFKIDEEGNYTYYNHPDVSSKIAIDFIRHLQLERPFEKNSKLRVDGEKVLFLVKNHMLPFNSNPELMRRGTIVKYFYFENYNLGKQLLQMAFLDASSAIKDDSSLAAKIIERSKKGQTYNLPGEERQDFTSIKRFISKIKEVGNNLDQFLPAKDKYSLNGLEIMEIVKDIYDLAIEKRIKIVDSKLLDQIKDIATSRNGSRLVGELMDIVLDDALINPQYYYKDFSTEQETRPEMHYITKHENKLKKTLRLKRAKEIIYPYVQMDHSAIAKISQDFLFEISDMKKVDEKKQQIISYAQEDRQKFDILVKKIFFDFYKKKSGNIKYDTSILHAGLDEIIVNF